MRWYELACQVARTPTTILTNQLRLSRSARCSFRAIARLHPEIGLLLDDLEAPWNLARQIAHAPGAAEQWNRAQYLLMQLVEKRATQDPSRGHAEATRLERLVQLVKPNYPVLRRARIDDAERYKPRPGAARSPSKPRTVA